MPTLAPIPRDVIAALSRWQALRKGHWTAKDAGFAQSALLRASELAAQTQREALARALTDLESYLGVLVDGDVATPNPTQLHRLGKLEEAVLAVLRAERDANAAASSAPAVSEDERKRLLVLAPETPLWRDFIERLSAGPLRVERFQQTSQLLQAMEPGLAAVLIDQDFLADLRAVADRLERARGAEALGATVLYLNRSRDAGARVAALNSGADASLEGEDPDYLVTRVGELINVRERQDHLRVLVVEDDRSQAMYCAAILRKQGIEVRTAAEAHNVLGEIRSFAPDLVLMDMHMPDMDGMQLTALIREAPELALLPIVFLTGDQDETSRFDALRAGGDDFLVKPVRPRHLVTAVVTRARRARALKLQFAGHQNDDKHSRLIHAGELVLLLRTLGIDRPCSKALLMCAADDGRLRSKDAHMVVERENQYQIGKLLQQGLGGQEQIAPWHGGGYLMLLDKSTDDELMARAETVREQLTTALKAVGGGQASVAVVPLPPESLPPAETLIDLAERTLAVSRHAGGRRVSRALAEAQTDLPADISLAIQKALALAPTAEHLSLLYQPIVPLHGAARPQYHLHLGLRVDLGGERVITRKQWLSLARQTGKSVALDLLAIEQVLDRIAQSRQKMPGLRIFVAVDTNSVVDPLFSETLLSGLVERGLTDPGLVLSIDQSEAMLMQNKLQVARRQLQLARVLLCLGRVGTDAKGNDVIDVLRPEVIAVDATAVRSAQQVPPVLAFARDRGAEVVAHFIPDAQTLARLFAVGLDYGMGGFIGAPSPRLDYDFGE